MLELLAYLVIALLAVSFMSSGVVRLVRLARNLERSVVTDCAVHNVFTILRRDGEHMPGSRGGFSEIAFDRIAFSSVLSHEIIRWYVDARNRLMRATHKEHSWEYAVVLEPVTRVHFTVITHNQRVQSFSLQLTHNNKIFTQTLWLTHKQTQQINP